MTSPDTTSALARLVDEAEVARVILRYARGLDRREFADVWSCFAPDAHVRGTRFEGALEVYLPQLLEGVRAFAKTIHFIGNQWLEVYGDVAQTETYAIAHHFADADGERETLRTGVRYLDRLGKQADGRWLITNREVVAEWVRDEAT